MGSDNAPLSEVLGAVQALQEIPNIRVLLVGQKDKLLSIIKEQKVNFSEEDIVHAPDVVTMHDKPTDALRNKKESSMIIGSNLLAKGEVDAFVSAGNTGAMVACGMFILGRLEGVGRPTIGTFMPNQAGITTIFDAGASVDSKPTHLLEYGIMGSIFVEKMHNIPQPKVGILSVGEEETKGNEVSKEAHKLLKNSSLNFIGNIEGRDILKGTAHVVVCDGFVGNIVLKFGEGVIPLLKHLIKDYASKSIWNGIKTLLVKSVLKETLKPLDYEEYGGVPLLGVKGITIIGHGSSSPKAIKNMIRAAKQMFDKDLLTHIQQGIADSKSKL